MKGKLPLEWLYHWEQELPDQPYLRRSVAGEWQDLTWKQVMTQARSMAAFINQQNYPQGSRIAIFCQNCPDWFVVDIAIMMSGHISVPLYPGQSADSMRYILSHSDSQMIFLGAIARDEELEGVLPETITTVGIGATSATTDFTLESITATTAPMTESPCYTGDKIFTIMYTSGTTGNPKGAMFDYQAVAYSVPRYAGLYDLDTDSRLFSYLPLAHAAERTVIEMVSMCTGLTVYFGESQETFVRDLQKVQPSLFFSVPRLWKKFREGVESKIPPARLEDLLDNPDTRDATRKQVLAGLGLGSVKHCISGSALLPEDLQKWYARIGIKLREVYSMTETFAYGTTSDGSAEMWGTVGRPLADNELRFSADGEIQFRNKAMMRGYYLEPEKTAAAIEDGFYCTGDTGYLDDNGCLRLTGRISEVFKTSKGKFVKPQPLENRLNEFNDLGQICVMGHGMDQPVALAHLAEGLTDAEREQINQRLRQNLEQLNQQLPAAERIRHIFMVSEEWTTENEMLTPTMKVKRRAVQDKYLGFVTANMSRDDMIVWE